jgi:hypothetical protein
MAKMRSPNYPALALPQAIESARELWNAEKRTPVSHETAAKAMGFQALSGPARVTIGALRQYGLIDKSEKGHVRISERAVTLLHGNEADRAQALADAAASPDLFQQLMDEHREASENAIRSYLITKKSFSEDGARKAAKAFRETIDLAGRSAQGYNEPTNTEKSQAMQGNTSTPGDVQDASKSAGAGTFSLTVPFAKGSISVSVRVTGDAMRPSHLARVRKYLELAEQDWAADDDEMGVPRPD